MKKVAVLSSIGLMLLLASLLIAWNGNPVPVDSQPKGDVPIPPNVRPLILLAGTDFEMGYQNYQQIAEVLHPYVLKVFQRTFSEKDLKILKSYEDLIRREVPEMIEYMKGMAKGATDAGIPLSYNEVLAGFVGTREIKSLSGQATEPGDCSGWAAWGTATRDGRLIVTGCGDHGLIANWEDETTLLVYPKTGNNYIVTTSSGGWHPGMNNKGLGYAHHGAGYCGRHNSDPLKPAQTFYGLPPAFTTPHTLRFANNANEAKDMIIGMTSTSRGLWADVNGNNWDVECNESGLFRKAGDNGERDFLYATNNALIKELVQEGETYIPHLGQWGSRAGISSTARNAEMWNMLNNYHGQVDLEFAKMMWRFASAEPKYATIEEAEALYMKTLGAGWDQHIGNLSNSSPGIGLPDNGNNGLWYVSQGPLIRFSNVHSPGNHYYHVDSTHTFYEVKLDESPQKAVAAAGERAHYDLYYANRELSKLTWSDIAFAPLKQIFDKAAEEWIRGEYYSEQAGKTKGNDSILNLGRAIRAYTRTQAYAKQVYEALVPPPAKPDDMGLGKYFGEWGEWLIHPHMERKAN